MKLCANSSVWMGLLALALIAGCEKRKSVPPMPPAPTSAPVPAPTPEAQEAQQQAQKTNEEPSTANQGTPPPDPGQAAEGDKTDKSKAKSARPRPTPKKPQQPSQTTTARNTPPRIVVKPEGPEPSSTPGQISPNPPNTEVSHDQATTEQLLQSSESSINNLKRTLTAEEQAIVAQIRDYVNQSRQAIKDNDLTRAHNFALKAHLLSDELVKRR